MAAEVLQRIHDLERFGSVLGLERLEELMRRLGDPQKGMKYIHVAGTNGKGSVCKFLESGLSCCGYRVGMYISPFIEVFNERIQCDGRYIDDGELDRIGSRVLDEVRKMTEDGLTSPTEFEAVMAIAFLYFAEKKPDIVILETGMGGIGDATNIIEDPLICVITSVSLDHMDVLGDTLEEIAENKAGIIKANTPVISNVRDHGPAAVIARKAYGMGCRLYDISGIKTAAEQSGTVEQQVSMDLWGTDYSDIRIPMAGRHQAENLKTALSAIEVLRRERKIRIERSRLYEGLAKAINPGRFEIIDEGSPDEGRPMVVIDGAHNEAGAAALKETVRDVFSDRRILMVIGILRDKEVDRILGHMTEITDSIIATSVSNPRSLSAEDLADRIRSHCPEPVAVVKDPSDCMDVAIEIGKDYDVILFAGSLYLIGEIRREYREKYTNGRKESQ